MHFFTLILPFAAAHLSTALTVQPRELVLQPRQSGSPLASHAQLYDGASLGCHVADFGYNCPKLFSADATTCKSSCWPAIDGPEKIGDFKAKAKAPVSSQVCLDGLLDVKQGAPYVKSCPKWMAECGVVSNAGEILKNAPPSDPNKIYP